jgi:hypothetical protein
MMSTDNNGVHVLVRVCPTQNPETDNAATNNSSSGGDTKLMPLSIDEANGTIALERKQKGVTEFKFSAILGPRATQADLYTQCQSIIGSDLLEGINCCIMAYGQTGSGKTYSMYGRGFGDLELTMNQSMMFDGSLDLGSATGIAGPFSGLDQDNETYGVAPRAITDLFQLLEAKCGPDNAGTNDQTDTMNTIDSCNGSKKFSYCVQCQLMQIYNEKIYDLLQDKRRENPLQLRDTRRSGSSSSQNQNNSVHVKGLSSYPVDNTEDVLVLLRRGLKNRAIRSTEFNQESSRGHTILQLNIEVEEEDDSSGEGLRVLKRSTLSLVDLAGSEKSSISTSMSLSGSMNSNVYASQMAAEAQQKEMNNINTSLHVLGNCVSALIEPNRKHIPYRNSVLTRLLQDSLGNSVGGRTVFIVTIKEDGAFREESYSTLQFANRASSIKMTVTSNTEHLLSSSFSGNANMSLEDAKRQIATLRVKLRQFTEAAQGIEQVPSLSQRRPQTTSLLQNSSKLTSNIMDEFKASASASSMSAVCVECVGMKKTVEQLATTVDELTRENERLSSLLEAALANNSKVVKSPRSPRAITAVAPPAVALEPPSGRETISVYDNNGSSSFTKRRISSAGRSAQGDDLEIESVGNSPNVPTPSVPATSTQQDIDETPSAMVLALLLGSSAPSQSVEKQPYIADIEAESAIVCNSPAVSSVRSLKKKILKDRMLESQSDEMRSSANLVTNIPRISPRKHNDADIVQGSAFSYPQDEQVTSDNLSLRNSHGSAPLLQVKSVVEIQSVAQSVVQPVVQPFTQPVVQTFAKPIQQQPFPVSVAPFGSVANTVSSTACAKHGLDKCILCSMFGYEQPSSVGMSHLNATATAAASTSNSKSADAAACHLREPLQSTYLSLSPPKQGQRSRHRRFENAAATNTHAANPGPGDDYADNDAFPSPSSSISSFSSLTAMPTMNAGPPSVIGNKQLSLRSPSSLVNTKKLLSNLDNSECAAHGLSKCLLCAMALGTPSGNKSVSLVFGGDENLNGLGSVNSANSVSSLRASNRVGNVRSSAELHANINKKLAPMAAEDANNNGSSMNTRDDNVNDSLQEGSVVGFPTSNEETARNREKDIVAAARRAVEASMNMSSSRNGPLGNVTAVSALDPSPRNRNTGINNYDEVAHTGNEDINSFIARKSAQRPIADYDPAKQIALLFGKKAGTSASEGDMSQDNVADSGAAYAAEYEDHNSGMRNSGHRKFRYADYHSPYTTEKYAASSNMNQVPYVADVNTDGDDDNDEGEDINIDGAVPTILMQYQQANAGGKPRKPKKKKTKAQQQQEYAQQLQQAGLQKRSQQQQSVQQQSAQAQRSVPASYTGAEKVYGGGATKQATKKR